MKKDILHYLKEHLSKRRYQHTLCVASIALLLGKLHNLPSEEIEIAALLHDSAKWMVKID